MIDLLRYVLTHFWPFIASVILIGTIGNAIAQVVYAFRRRPS